MRSWDVEVTPYQGVGPVTFGMSKGDVQALLGSPEREFVRNPLFAPEHVEWIFDGGRAFVEFDGLGKCVGVMLAPPSDPRLRGTRLLGIGAAAAWAELKRLDPTAYVEDACLVSRELGVVLYAPDVGTEWEEPDEPAHSLLVITSSYFNRK